MFVLREKFERDPGHYLDLMDKEEIILIENGEFIGKLIGVKSKILDSLVGIIPDDGMSLDEIKAERLRKYEDHV